MGCSTCNGSQVCRQLTVWDFVTQEDLVPRLDHLHNILSSDLCFHWPSCPGCFGDVNNLMNAVGSSNVDDDMCIGIEPGHQVARVGTVVVVYPYLLPTLQPSTQHCFLDVRFSKSLQLKGTQPGPFFLFFRSARTSWNTFVRPSVRPFARAKKSKSHLKPYKSSQDHAGPLT